MVYPVNWGRDRGGIHKDAEEGRQEGDLGVTTLGWCLAACGPRAMFFLVS